MPQMRTPRDPEALRTLLRLDSPRNLSGGDTRMAQRTADVSSGLDELVPEADSPDYMAEQEELARSSGMGFSREALRGRDLTGLRRLLRMEDTKHRQALERAVVPAQVKGAYDVEASKQAAGAQMDRLLATQDAIGQRQSATQQALDARQLAGERIGDERQQASLAARVDKAGTVPQQMYDAYNTAKKRAGGLAGRLLPGRKQEAQNALTALLHRSGSLDDVNDAANALGGYQGTLDQRIAAASADPDFEFDLSGLNEYERAYLEMRLGQ